MRGWVLISLRMTLSILDTSPTALATIQMLCYSSMKDSVDIQLAF